MEKIEIKDNKEIVPIPFNAEIKFGAKKISSAKTPLISLSIYQPGKEPEKINMKSGWHDYEVEKKKKTENLYIKAIKEIVSITPEEDKKLRILIKEISKLGAQLETIRDVEDKKIEMQKNKDGSCQLKIQTYDKNGDIYFMPLLHFSDIKIYLYDYFDPETNKFSKEEIIDLRLTRDTESISLTNGGLSIEMAHLLKTFSIISYWKQGLKYSEELSEYFKTQFKEDFKEKATEKYASPIYGPSIYKNKIIVMHGENCDLRDNNIQEDSKLQAALIDTIQRERALCDKEINKEDMKKLLEMLKEIPIQKENKETWYKTLALSLASYFRFVLFDAGVKLMPYILIIGPAKEGKSKIYAELLVEGIHNSAPTTSETLQASAIRMYYKMGGSTRPVVLDEGGDLTKMRRENIDLLKMGATRKLGGELLRGKRDLTFDNPDFPRNICITANEFKCDDISLQSRFEEILIPKGHSRGNKFLNNNDLVFIKDNAMMIGKELIKTCEDKDLLDQIKKIVGKYKNKNEGNTEYRIGDRKIVLEVGRLLLKKIYDKYEIENKDLDKIKLEPETSVSYTINTKIKRIMATVHTLLTKPYHIREGEASYDFTPMELFEAFNSSTFVPTKVLNRMADNGIYIAGGKNDVDGIFLSKKFINTLNQNLRMDHLSTIRDLSEILKDDNMNVYYISSSSSKREADKATCAVKISETEIKYLMHGLMIPIGELKDFNNEEQKKEGEETTICQF